MFCHKLILAFILSGASIATPVPSSSPSLLPSPNSLRFKTDETFHLSIFEDLHYAEGPQTIWGPAHDKNSTMVMNNILKYESPDLVVINGDLITGENTYFHNSTDYVDIIVAPMVQRGIRWASTYGNHDSNFNLSREALWEREHLYSGSLTGRMVLAESAGISNYFLPVFSSSKSDLKPQMILWFFDSRGSGSYQKVDTIRQPNWVDQTVVDWFKSTKASLKNQFNTDIPSLAFVHIPTETSRQFQMTVGVDAHKEPGINDDYPNLAQQALRQDGSYGGNDIPFMAELVATPGLMGVFSGHDHGNDWCGKWKGKYPGMSVAGNGLNLCFGRHTGYGGYGEWTRGSRQILVNQKTLGKSVDTWIRLENEVISGRVLLNATYGSDVYPLVKDTFSGR